MQYKDTQHLGMYEHFYGDSVFGPTPSTHYIPIGLLMELSISIDELPQDQHALFLGSLSIRLLNLWMFIHTLKIIFTLLLNVATKP